jgi:twitching motility protein PilJ
MTQFLDGLKQRLAAFQGFRKPSRIPQTPRDQKSAPRSGFLGSLRTKFLLAFFLMIGLTGVLGALTWVNQNKAQDKVNELLNREFRFAKLSLEIGNMLRRAQGLQKDYLLYYQTIGLEQARSLYLTKFDAAVDQVGKKTDDIKAIADDQRDQNDAGAIKQTIGEYQKLFHEVVTLLHNREGFKGLLRSHIYYLDDDLRSPRLDRLKVLLLRVQQHEKDYFLSADPSSAQAMDDVLDTFKTEVGNTRFGASQKFALVAKAEAYRGAFKHSVKAGMAVQERQRLFRSKVRSVESLVDRMTRESSTREALAQQELTNIGLQVQLIGIIGTVVVLGVGMFLALFLSTNLTKPLLHLKGVMEQIVAGNYSVRAQVQADDEVGAMTVSLNTMLDKVLSLVQSQEERDVMQASIMKLLEEVSDVAEGDLTVEAEVTEDMTGAIADSFNYMIHQLCKIVTNVQEATLLVSSSANEIQATAEHLADGSTSQATQIVESSAALDEMVASIHQVSENATLSATVAEQALANAKQGTEAVQNTIEAMQRMQNQVESMTSRIRSLDDHSQQIGEIVTLIGDIADRTSVLALNASIEAALAGEEGQGFAVVAREVERLAERSVDATQQIRDLVGAMQTETDVVVTVIEESAQEVMRSAEVADRAEQALAGIESVSTRLAELIQAISLAAQQQARGSESLSSAMGDISEVTQQTATGVKQSAVSISQLATLAEELRDSVSTFKLPGAPAPHSLKG